MNRKVYTLIKSSYLLVLAILWSCPGKAQAGGANCTANAGGNRVVCDSSTTLIGTVANILGPLNSPLWTFISGPVTPTIVSPNNLTTNVMGMTADGAYVFRLTRNCGTGVATSDVTITAHPRPASFTAGPDVVNVCATTGTTTLAGVIPAGFTGVWRAINIYSLNRFTTTVSTNAQFSSTTTATPVFSLVNKSAHQIDPSYYAILRITSADGICSYEDTAVVRFIPNPAIDPVAITSRCYDSSNSNPEQFYFSLNSAPYFSTAISGAAGTAAAGTTVTLTPVSQPAGGAIAFNRIDNNIVYLNGTYATGTYVFKLTVTNACGTYTTPNITYVYPGTRPRNVNFQPTGHAAPEQLVLYSSGGSGGEVHCGIANTGTPENFYFSIDPLDSPTVITNVSPNGIAPPGGAPTVSVTGAGTRNRVATVTPPNGGWQVGTYRFSVNASNSDGSCGFTQLYYIHISDGSRPAVSVPDISVCYPGTGATSANIPLPAIYKGAVNTSYFQDFSGYYDFSVVSKPAGSATPVYTTTNLRDLTTASTTISNLDKVGDYVFRITAKNGNGQVGPFLEQEYACSGTSLTSTFTVHVENPVNANAGSSQTIPCSQSTALLANSPGTGTGLWTLVSAPAGSTPALSGNTIINPVLSSTNVPGTYTYRWTITSPYGGCTSSNDVAVTVAATPGSDFGDLSVAVWPVASAAQGSCAFTNSKPDNYNGTTVTTTSVWAGNQINTENATVNGGNAAANTDLYDDGLMAGSGGVAYITPGTPYPLTLMLNANRAATTVYFRVWADWNADGDFTNDLDTVSGQGGNATYAGNATVTTAGTAVPYNFNITPPAGASAGYKIRVAVSSAAIADVYRSSGAATVLALASGEIEDYSAPVPLCNAQSATAPILSRTGIMNNCPAATADLSAITASNQNGSVSLTWHSAIPAGNGNRLSSVTALGAGQYYAAFYDAANDCYSTATTAVTVTTTPCFQVSGFVFPDADGSVVRGAGKAFASLPFPMYVYLVNGSGIVADSAAVAADGSYKLDVNSGSAYRIELSVVRYPIGLSTGASPIATGLTGKWKNTGESANGTVDAAADGILAVPTVSGNLINYNFGIEQAPATDTKAYNVAEAAFSDTPPPGYPSLSGYKSIVSSSAALTGYATGGSLSGSDPEDCQGAGSCNTGASFAITGINANTKLYYNYADSRGLTAVDVSAGAVLIDGFDPSRLVVYGKKGTGTAASPVGFTYVLVDKAGIPGNTAGYSIQTAVPLPVGLACFNARKEHNSAWLDWLAYDEKGSLGFEVQRSGDAQRWEVIGFKASSPGAAETAYDYTDEFPLTGSNYYRLRQVVSDGSARYSIIRSLSFGGADIRLSPNPVTDELTISGLTAPGELILENAHGKTLKTQRISGFTGKISMGALPAGVYFILLKKYDGGMESYRILKK